MFNVSRDFWSCYLYVHTAISMTLPHDFGLECVLASKIKFVNFKKPTMPTRSQYGKQEMRPVSNPESSDPGMELNLQGLDMNSPVEFRTFVVFFFLVTIFLQGPIVFVYDALRSPT